MLETIFMIIEMILKFILIADIVSFGLLVAWALRDSRPKPAEPLPAGTIIGTASYSGGRVFCGNCRWLSEFAICHKKIGEERIYVPALGEEEIKPKEIGFDWREYNHKNDCKFWEEKSKK